MTQVEQKSYVAEILPHQDRVLLDGRYVSVETIRKALAPSPATGSAVPASTVTAKDIQHLKTIAQGIEDGGWHIAALHLTAIRQKLEATVAPSPVGEGQDFFWVLERTDKENWPSGGWPLYHRAGRRHLTPSIREAEKYPSKDEAESAWKTMGSPSYYEAREHGFIAAQAPKPASAGGEVIEMRLCETAFLGLRPNQLYHFTVDPNCPKCVACAEPYAAEADTAKQWACPKCGQVNAAWKSVCDGCSFNPSYAEKFGGNPPAADRLAQTVTDAEVEAACIAANGFAWWDSGAGVGEKETVRVVIRKILEAAIRASESAPAQEGIREAVMRVMRVERDHAIEVFCAADGQSSPKTREEFKAAWDALNELLPLAAAPRAGG